MLLINYYTHLCTLCWKVHTVDVVKEISVNFIAGFKKSIRLDQSVLLKHYKGAILSSSGGYMDVRH